MANFRRIVRTPSNLSLPLPIPIRFPTILLQLGQKLPIVQLCSNFRFSTNFLNLFARIVSSNLLFTSFWNILSRPLNQLWFRQRAGVIIKCPQNGLLYNLPDIIITSQMANTEMANDDGNDVQTLGNVFYWFQLSKITKGGM